MPLVLTRSLRHGTAPVTRTRWTCDGRYVITCGHDKTLRLWNPHRSAPAAEGEALTPGLVESALHVKEYAGQHGHEVTDVAIAHDNASFASCGGDRVALLWNVSEGTVLRKFEGHAQVFFCSVGEKGGRTLET